MKIALLGIPVVMYCTAVLVAHFIAKFITTMATGDLMWAAGNMATFVILTVQYRVLYDD